MIRRILLILLTLSLAACHGGDGPFAAVPCWVHPHAQIDTIGWVLRSSADTVGPALTCTTDPRIRINPAR